MSNPHSQDLFPTPTAPPPQPRKRGRPRKTSTNAAEATAKKSSPCEQQNIPVETTESPKRVYETRSQSLTPILIPPNWDLFQMELEEVELSDVKLNFEPDPGYGRMNPSQFHDRDLVHVPCPGPSSSKGVTRKYPFDDGQSSSSSLVKKKSALCFDIEDDEGEDEFDEFNELLMEEPEEEYSEDAVREGGVPFTTIVDYHATFHKVFRQKQKNDILRTILDDTDRARFIRNSVIMACKTVINDWELSAKDGKQIDNLIQYVQYVAIEFPYIYGRFRKRRSGKRSHITAKDKSSPEEIHGLLEVVFTVLTSLLLYPISTRTCTGLKKATENILNLLLFNDQVRFFTALTTIECVFQDLMKMDPKDKCGSFEPKLTLYNSSNCFSIQVDEGMKKENLVFSFRVLFKYWHHIANRVAELAETYFEILCWLWQMVEIPAKFELIKYFPIPICEISLTLEVQACRLLEMIVHDSLDLIESVEFLSFCHIFEQLQLVHGSIVSVRFILNVNKILNETLRGKHFRNSRLVHTKCAIVKMVCRIKEYIQKTTPPRIYRIDFPSDLLEILPKSLPFALVAMDGMIFRECLACFPELIRHKKLCSSPPDEEKDLEFDLQLLDPRNPIVEEKIPEVLLCEISTIWRGFIEQWQNYIRGCQDVRDTGAPERLLVLSKELFKLAARIKLKFVESEDTKDPKQVISTRIARGKIHLVFFPFRDMELWTRVVGRVLQFAERTPDGMEAIMSLLVEALKVMPQISYTGRDITNLKQSWSWYLTCAWMPSHLVPECVNTGYSSWRNESIKNCELLLENCVSAISKRSIRCSSEKLVHILNVKASSGIAIGALKLIADFNCWINEITWQNIIKYILTVMKKHKWIEDDKMTFYLASAIARIPCIISRRVALRQTPAKVLDYEEGCYICDSGDDRASNRTLVNVKDPILKVDLGTAIYNLFLPVSLHSKQIEAKTVALPILERLRRHGLRPKPYMAAAFMHHLSPTRTITVHLVDKLLVGLRKYLDFELPHYKFKYSEDLDNLDDFNRTMDVIVIKIIMHIESAPDTKLGLKEVLLLFVGLTNFVKTKDDRLLHRMVGLIMQIMLTYKNIAIRTLCRSMMAALAEENKVARHEIFFSVRVELAKDFVDHCLCAYFGEARIIPDKPTRTPPAPHAKGKKNFPPGTARKETLSLCTTDITEDENRQIRNCKLFFDGLSYVVGISNAIIGQVFTPALLSRLMLSLRVDRRRLLMMHSLANYCGVSIKAILVDYFPYYIPEIVIEHEIEVANEVLTVLHQLGIETAFIGKCIFQTFTDEMIVKMNRHPPKILQFFNCLPNWLQGKAYRPDLPPTVKPDAVLDLLGERLMGFYMFMDRKLHSKEETWDTKTNILASFSALLRSIGQHRLAPTVQKVYSLLNSFGNLGPEIHDVLCGAWMELAKCLDNSNLESMVRQIFAALLSLKECPSGQQALEESVKFLVLRRSEAFQSLAPKLYFLTDQVTNRSAVCILQKNCNRSSRKQLFFLLLDELSSGNSHIQRCALGRLVDFLAGREDSFDINADFLSRESLQQQVCKFVMSLVDITRSENLETRLLAGKCLGLLGAIDNFRVMFKTLSEDKSWVRRDVNAAAPGFGARYLQELGAQIRIVEKYEDFDHIAFCIQEVLVMFSVNANTGNEIWASLPAGTRSVLQQFLTSRYTLNSQLDIPEEFPTPLFGSEYGKTYHSWVSNWIFQMISFLPFNAFHKRLFNLSKNVIARNVKLATFLLPTVAVHAASSCSEDDLRLMKIEIDNLIEPWWINPVQTFEESSAVMNFEKLLGSDVASDVANPATQIVDRVLCTNAVLSIMDTIKLCVQVSPRNQIIATAAWQAEKCELSQVEFGDPDTNVIQIHSLLVDDESLSLAAFWAGSFQRALVYIEEYLKTNYAYLQDIIPYLQRIYVALGDADSVGGLNALRIAQPEPIELVLDSLANGKIAESSYFLKRMTEKDPNDFTIKQALVQTYLNLDQPETAYDLILAYEKHALQSSDALQFCRAEACWNLGKWDELEGLCQKAKQTKQARKWTFTVAEILVSIRNNKFAKALEDIRNSRLRLLGPLAAASLDVDAYHKRYGEITRLHVLAEMEQVVHLLQLEAKNLSDDGLTNSQDRNFRQDTTVLLKNWDRRLKDCQSLKVLDPVLHVRKALMKIMQIQMKTEGWALPMLNDSIRDTWLHIAKAERKRGNFIRVRNCMEEANAYPCAIVLYQEAKYLVKSGSMDKAISLLGRGIVRRVCDVAHWKAIVEQGRPVCLEQILFSKVVLLNAYLNDISGNTSMDECVSNYMSAINLNKESEQNHFSLGSFHTRLYEAMESGDPLVEFETLSSNAIGLIRHYSLSLQYGIKNVFQSLPRLLSCWLDYHWNKCPVKQTSNSQTEKLSRLKTHAEIMALIRDMREKVPSFVYLTAFTQLMSRLCHNNADIWNELKEFISLIICDYPNQTLWMTMSALKSGYPIRVKRCLDIFKLARDRKEVLKPLIRDYNALSDQLIRLAGASAAGAVTGKVSKLCNTLPKVLADPNFSKIILPFKRFLFSTFPRKMSQINHREIKAYPNPPVYIVSILDEVYIMNSLQRPKRINFRGSDGRLYGFLCKARDDLRKDAKIMEMNHILNLYLEREADCRERQLHVRMYAVVPLNEKCGLIEWVSNLGGLRPIVNSVLKKNGANLTYANTCGCQPEDGQDIRLRVLTECLRLYKPVLGEWFLQTYPDPRVWYWARENFTRTAAVMSVFGFLMGLGDRHGENILIDTTNGQLVHVDFNCLFNLGDTFRFPERVPFRLTQNMIHAMGVLGKEGTFRRCCEISLRVVRANASIFTAVLRPFVYDPLVEWTKKQPGEVPLSFTGEINNDKAWESLVNFTQRLEGKRRNMSKEIDLPFSVEGQIRYLMKESMDTINLCNMFHGWTAYV